MTRSLLNLPAAAVLLVAAMSTFPVQADDRPISALTAVVAATREREFAPAIEPADIRPHIEFLASPELRGRGGRERTEAARYIVTRFRELGLDPLFPAGRYAQDIPGKADENGVRPVIGRNVGAILPGSDPAVSDEIIIVSAHYDHLGTSGGEVYAGADDNASGVAMVLEVARQLTAAGQRPRRTIAFVGFDMEEQMLWGSRWFASHTPWPIEQVKLFITADMIGRSLGNLPLPAVFVLGTEHAPQLKEAFDVVGRPAGLEVARLGTDLIGTRSDYGPFRDREVPYLFFSTGEHPDYHTPRDTPDRIDYEKAARVSSLVLRIVQHVGETSQPPVWSPAVNGDLDEVHALQRITTLLMAAGDERPLSDIQRYMITTVKNKTGRILEKGEMTPGDRTWLIRMAQLLLLSVF